MAAADEAEELIEAALVGMKIRLKAEVPFADETELPDETGAVPAREASGHRAFRERQACERGAELEVRWSGLVS